MINLAGVTRTLGRLIQYGVQEITESPDLISFSPRPPDLVDDGLISVHLYHSMESPEFKNHPPQGGTGAVPNQFSPMALILQYVVSMPATEVEGDDTGFVEYEAQRILGYVTRILRDYPVVDDELVIGTSPLILDGELDGYPIELNLRPVKTDEAVSFWAAEQTMTPRLSLFVEARVAILEPREPEVIPGRVHRIGGGIIANMGPRLLSGSSEQTFALPAVTGRSSESLSLSPPRPSVFRSGALPGGVSDSNNQIAFKAEGLAPSRRLALSGTGLRDAGNLSVETIEVPIDAVPSGFNSNWNFQANANSLRFSVQSEVEAALPGEAATTTYAVTPGAYTLRVIQNNEALGGVRMSSGLCPFEVVPQTLGTTFSAGAYTLNVAGAYLQTTEQVALSINGLSYRQVSAAPAAGEFRVVGAGSDSAVEFVLAVTASPAADAPLAVTLIVNGVSATPEWLEA